MGASELNFENKAPHIFSPRKLLGSRSEFPELDGVNLGFVGLGSFQMTERHLRSVLQPTPEESVKFLELT